MSDESLASAGARRSLVFLLEDASMKVLLEGLLPRIVPADVDCTLVSHDGKADLDKSIPKKLRAWQDKRASFVIVRDQDSADCKVVKARLEAICAEASDRPVLIRIACREVESWYLADLSAVDGAFGTSLAPRQNQKKYRAPDYLGAPSDELVRLVPEFSKVSGARSIAPFLDLDNVRSSSFRHFVSGLRRLITRTSEPQS